MARKTSHGRPEIDTAMTFTTAVSGLATQLLVDVRGRIEVRNPLSDPDGRRPTAFEETAGDSSCQFKP